jgi:hypothetical protein
VFLNLISEIYFMYKFIISCIKQKQNIFSFLKYRPSSHDFNKLVIKFKMHGDIYFGILYENTKTPRILFSLSKI